MASKDITLDLSPNYSNDGIHGSIDQDASNSPERVQFTVEATERGPPPSYEEAIDPSRAPPPSYESVIGRVRQVHKESSGTIDFFKKLIVLLAGTLGCTIAVGASVVVPLAMLAIGLTYLNDCPVNTFIPIYLLVGGFVGILKQFLQCLYKLRRAYRNRGESDEEEPKSSCQSLITCFMLIWFFLGSYWVYKEFKPDYNPNAGGHYCNRTVYLFAFWQITCVYMVFFLLIFCLFSISVCALTYAHSHMRMHSELDTSNSR